MNRLSASALFIAPLVGLLAACSSAPVNPTGASSEPITVCQSSTCGGPGPVTHTCNCTGWTECNAVTGACLACGLAGDAPCTGGTSSKESGCEAPTIVDTATNRCVALSSAGACPGWAQLSASGAQCTACGTPAAPPCTEASAGETGCETGTVLTASGTCVACGANDLPACAGGVCDPGTGDVGGTCSVPCGANGQPACPGNVCNPGTSDTSGTCCATGTTSFEGYCVPCGGNLQIACNGNGCPLAECAGGTCNPGYVLGNNGTETGVCVCGQAGMPACPGGCGAGTVDVGGTCECGANGQPACSGSAPVWGCNPGTVAVGSPATCFTCGGNGDPPCATSGCSAGTVLTNMGAFSGSGECETCGATSGPACAGSTCPGTACASPPCVAGTDPDGSGVTIVNGTCAECGLNGQAPCTGNSCNNKENLVPVNGVCAPLQTATWTCKPAEVSGVAFTQPIVFSVTNSGDWAFSGGLNSQALISQSYTAGITLSAGPAPNSQYGQVTGGQISSEFANDGSNNKSWTLYGFDATIPGNWKAVSSATSRCNLGIGLNPPNGTDALIDIGIVTAGGAAVLVGGLFLISGGTVSINGGQGNGGDACHDPDGMWGPCSTNGVN